MLRLLIVTDFFKPEPGGIELFFSNLSTKWKKENIEVLITTIGNNYLSEKEVINDFEKKIYFPIYRFHLHKGKNFNIVNSYKNKEVISFFKEKLSTFKPDCILFSSITLLHFVLARVAKKLNIPYILYLNPDNLLNNFSHFNFLNRYFSKHCELYLSPSKFVADLGVAQGLIQDKIKILPLLFDYERWQKIVKNSIKKRNIVLPNWLHKTINNKKVLLSVGPLLPRKGLDIVIRSFAKINEQVNNLHYVIVGSGPELEYLKEIAKIYKVNKFISFTGIVSDEELGFLYSNSYLFLQPGTLRDDDAEALGNVFMEAAWFGLPVVASDHGGIPEIVKHKHSGYLHPSGDVDKFINNTVELLLNDKLHKFVSTQSRKIAKNKFSKWSKINIENYFKNK